MRLQSLSLKNFRCFRQEVLDLSGDVTLIYARNGVGKTTIFDAIELALLGDVDRFANDSPGLDVFANQYGVGGFRVDLSLVAGEFDAENISVNWDESKDRLELQTSRGFREHRDLLYNFLIDSDALQPARRQKSLAAALFRSSVLLSQDSMRRFIEGSPSERSLVVSQLAGTALLSSCLTKAEDVQTEARRRSEKVARKIVEAKEAVAASSADLEEYERVVAQVRSLADDELVQSALEPELQRIGLDREALGGLLGMPPSEVTAQIDARIDAAGSDLEAVMASVREAKEGLSLAATLDKQVAAAEERLQEVKRQVEDLSETIDGQAKLSEELRRRVEDVSERLSARERRLGRVRRIATLERELEEARGEATDIAERIRPIEERLGELGDLREANEKKLTELLDSRAELAKSLTKTEQAIENLDQVRSGYERRTQLQRQIAELEKAQAAAEEDLRALLARLSGARAALDEATKLEARTAQEFTAEQATSEKWEGLASQLADLVLDHSCPLCGAEYESRKSLREAIDAKLQSIPQNLRSLAAQARSTTAARVELAAEVRELEATHDPLATSVNEDRARIQDLQRDLITIEDRLTNEPNQDRLGSMLQTKRKEVKVQKERYDDLSRAIDDVVSQRKVHEEWWQTEQERVRQLHAEEATAKGRVEDLVKELETLRNTEKQEAVQEGSPLDESAAMSAVDQARSELQAAEEALADHRSSVRKNSSFRDAALEAVAVAERKLAVLKAERGRLQDVFARAGFEGVPSQEVIEAKIGDYHERMKALPRARRVILAHIREEKMVAASEERKMLQAKLSANEIKLSDWRKQYSALGGAQSTAAEWATALKDEIETVVAGRVTRHRGTIWRLFAGMIPDPYHFGGLEIDEVDGGIELGIKYRGRSTPAGEPKHYLSHAQANVLALAVFFAFGMAQQWSHLRTLLLDDPVQHLDDLDSVAFIDTVRGCVPGDGGRQIVMSTCDRDLYILMLRKLGLLEREGIRVTGMTLRDGGVEGPRVNYDYGGPLGRRIFATAG